MQRILTEDEYQNLKASSDKFNEIKKVIHESIKPKSTPVYAYGTHGEKLACYYKNEMTFNMDISKVFKICGLDVPSTFCVEFSND